MNISDTKRETQWRLLAFELFVAFSLFVAFFFLVRNFFAYGNPMSANVFMAGSEKLYRLNEPIMGAHWNSRLSGLMVSGALMDYSLNEPGAGQAQIERLANIFGLYHSLWLLLLFFVIIFALRYSLFINLGIFAGLMYDFSPISGPYFFPWDLPAMFFFTLAALLFGRRRIWLMVLVILAGAFFRETVLTCLFIIFFAGHWKWSKRIMVFAGTFAVYALGKKILLKGLQLEELAVMGDTANMFQVFSPFSIAGSLFDNLKVLFAPTFNSIIFANAGTAVAVLVFCWQKRFLPYLAVILAYLAGLVFLPLKPAGITEARVFMQILPLSFILLTEVWMKYIKVDNGTPASTDDQSAWAMRDTFPLLLPLTIAVVAISTCVATLQYYVLFEDLQPANQAQSQLGKYTYNGGSSTSLDAICQWFQNGYTDGELKLAIASQRDHQDAGALAAYQRVLDVDPNSIYALNNLAMLLATDSNPRLRDGNRAVNLAERACQLTDYKQAILIYTLAAAYAEAGRYGDAVAAADKAQAAALAQGQSDIVKENEPLVELYKGGHPLHQQAEPAP